MVGALIGRKVNVECEGQVTMLPMRMLEFATRDAVSDCGEGEMRNLGKGGGGVGYQY